MEPLKTGPDTKIIAFMLAIGNARQSYILARLGLLEALFVPSCLLAQQSLEYCIKATARIYWHEIESRTGKKIDRFLEGHHLVSLMRRAAPYVPQYNAILNDHTKKEFLKELSEVYRSSRFGETGLSIDGQKSIGLLDDLFATLFQIYRDCLKFPKYKLFVPKNLQTAFLFGNANFKTEDISHNILETLGS